MKLRLTKEERSDKIKKEGNKEIGAGNLNFLDGDRAAIEFDNKIERNDSEKRWDAYYKGCKDARNHKSFNTVDYINEDEIEMYKLGWENIKNKR